MGKYNYDKIENELMAEIEKLNLTDEQLNEITSSGVEVALKTIKGKMNFKRGYSQGKLDVVADETTTPGVVEVGWTKYYGFMLEKGTVKMSAQPHLRPAIAANITKIQNAMIEKMKEKLK